MGGPFDYLTGESRHKASSLDEQCKSLLAKYLQKTTTTKTQPRGAARGAGERAVPCGWSDIKNAELLLSSNRREGEMVGQPQACSKCCPQIKWRMRMLLCCSVPSLPLLSLTLLCPQNESPKKSRRVICEAESWNSVFYGPHTKYLAIVVAVAVVYCFVRCCCRCCCCCCFVLLHIGRKVKAKAARRMRRIKNVACHLNFFLLKFV